VEQFASDDSDQLQVISLSYARGIAMQHIHCTIQICIGNEFYCSRG